MNFFPQLPIHFNPIALFGLTLFLGLLGGEIANFTKILPRISGYIAVGFIFGPNGFNIATQSVLNDASFFVDIALGLILFDLGRHLDFRWLYHDVGLLPMAVAESSLTFGSIFFILHYFNFEWLPAALAATIATATSPAVVMMVAHDISSEGPITRRAMMLTSMNNLFALILFAVLLPITHIRNVTPEIISEHITYRLLGSLILGVTIFLITIFLSKLTGKKKESQFIMFVGAVTLGIGLAISLNLSTMLTLFTFGVAARNLDFKHILTEVDFGWLGRIFIILLFVVTGVYLNLKGLWNAALIVILFVAAKVLAKIIGISFFGRLSHLTRSQSLALGVAMTPMAELAIGMSNKLVYFNPNFNHRLIMIITAVVAILYILAPIGVQLSFIKSGEVET